jgi:DNA-binding transcriptional LysR family regulator
MLDALTLDQMRVFVAVAEAGSFRAAAARLARVQSAVSHAIATLEDQLAVALFDRAGHHRPVLTPAGKALLADVRVILTKVDAVRARARRLGEGVELELAVALDPQFPLGLAGAALKDLHDAYPSVGLRLWTAPLGAAIAALREGSCALAITAAELPDPRIELEALSFVTRAAVAAPTRPLAIRSAAGEALGKAELADHVQIVAEDPSPLTEGRDFGVLSPGTWRAGDNATKHALILAGIGWGKPAALDDRARPRRAPARPRRRGGVRPARRDGHPCLAGAPDGPAPRSRGTRFPRSAAQARGRFATDVPCTGPPRGEPQRRCATSLISAAEALQPLGLPQRSGVHVPHAGPAAVRA